MGRKIYLKILGIPQPKQSVRSRIAKTKDGRQFVQTYQKKEIKENEGNIRSSVTAQLPTDFKPFDKAVRINKLHYVFPPLKSFNKATDRLVKNGIEVPKTTKPDITDNLAKGLMDAMNGVVFIDDSLICEMNNVKKFYGEVPRIEIELEEIQ